MIGLSFVSVFELIKAPALARIPSSTIYYRRPYSSPALVEFLLVREAGTSVFAVLLLISLVDAIGGWVISVRTARRDITFEPGPQ